MGLAKELLISIQERGYGQSDKFICQYCIQDEYIRGKIIAEGERGTCSFCKDENGRAISNRKVLPLETAVGYMMPAIRYYYLPADTCLPWDSEAKEYMGNTIDTYDFAHDVLRDELGADNGEIADEISNMLDIGPLTSAYQFSEQPYVENLKRWEKYCKQVKARRDLSAEQIVSLSQRDDAPEDLKEIKQTFEMVLEKAWDMDAYSFLIRNQVIFRCCNYKQQDTDDSCKLRAQDLGTPPAHVAGNNRFSEKGDMMFYGADNEEIAAIEIGRNKENPEYPITVARFSTNKQLKLLNLRNLGKRKKPSIFDLRQKEIRESWQFLDQFIRAITASKDGENSYKPTQVFTKYIQRVTGLNGICYRSSKSRNDDINSHEVKDCCYVLFAEDRDCLNDDKKVEKRDRSRTQLILVGYEQRTDLLKVIDDYNNQTVTK